MAPLVPVTGGLVRREVAVQRAVGSPPALSVTEFAPTALTPRWPSALQPCAQRWRVSVLWQLEGDTFFLSCPPKQ